MCERYFDNYRTDFVCDVCGYKYDTETHDIKPHYIASPDKTYCFCDDCVGEAVELLAKPATEPCECSECGDMSPIPCKDYWLFDGEIFCRHCLEELIRKDCDIWEV